MKRWSKLVLVLLIAAAPAQARAQQTVRLEASGQAAVGQSGARTMALDSAFAAAVGRALQTLLSPAQRAQHEAALRESVLRRARLFVASYQVVAERSQDGRVQVDISASIDLDRLRQTLSGIGITVAATPAVAPSAPGDRPRVAVLVGTDDGNQPQSTFGPGAGDGGAAGRSAVEGLRQEGFEALVPVPGGPAPEPGGELPIGEDAAVALARQGGAGAALVIGVAVRADGRIRGTRYQGAAGTARVRLVDAGAGQPVARAEVTGGGHGEDQAAALAAAAAALGGAAVRAVARELAGRWPLSVPREEGLLVRVRGAAEWRPVALIVEQLSRTPGITQVVTRMARQGEIVLAVQTALDAARVSAAVRAAPLGEWQSVTQPSGAHHVDVVLGGG
jgi:hypothetical protein